MLSITDWVIIVGFLLLSLLISLFYRKQAGKSLNDFFLGGRNLPWYIAGMSMVATTFAADTPLAVTELVANNGISGNWIWWCYLTGGILTTFFFANLWRRANILTEVEFINIRYSGKEANLLRGFKSVYLGLIMNVIIIGWVNLAMATILEGLFGVQHTTAIIICLGLMIITSIYSSLAGLKGIAITDTIQFFIALTACVILAVIILNSNEVGGITGLKKQLPQETFNFFPTLKVENSETVSGIYSLGIWSFIAFFGMMWWASWYPGAEPGGGGYVAQRMMSAKDEKNAVFATLFFQIGHYCLRPWPWILVALCALIVYSPKKLNKKEQVVFEEIQQFSENGVNKDLFLLEEKQFVKTLREAERSKKTSQLIIASNLEKIETLRNKVKKSKSLKKSIKFSDDKRFGFVFAIKDFLPSNGLLGLLLVAFLAAYMSTISTQLNWGAGYLVNDLYKPFIDPKATEDKYVLMSRIITGLLMLVGFVVTFFITSISGAWEFIMECGAGLGLVLILRWYWWRINAWSEISATVAPFIGFSLARYVVGLAFPFSFFFTVAFTTIVWLSVTFLTSPTEKNTLKSFYMRVRPQGAWKPVCNSLGIQPQKSTLGYSFISWLSATTMVYAVLFSTGKFIFQEYSVAFIWLVIALIAFGVLYFSIKSTWKKEVD